MEKSNIIDALKKRVDDLEKWQKEPKESGKKNVEKADEDVCPECGGDLLFVEEGIVQCPKCNQFYELSEVKEE